MSVFGVTTNVTDNVFVNDQGSLVNDTGGIINNNGTIILTGDLVNNSIFVSGNNSNINLEGGIQDIGGSASTTFNNLEIAGTDNKTESISSKVRSTLNFTANKFIIGNNNLTLLPDANITGFDNDRFVVTNGTGFLQKNELTKEIDYTFPVGTDVSFLNYKPVILNYFGTTDTFSVRVEPGPSPVVGFSLPECVLYTYYVKEANQTGNTGTLTLGWNHNATDEGGALDENSLRMWQFDGSNWNTLQGTNGYLTGTNGTDREYKTQDFAISDFYGSKSRFMIKSEVATQLFIPEAFSPNNDGHNDILYVRGKGIQFLQFAVYDRWGEKVFESDDITKGWDGTYKGVKLSTGVFNYYVKAIYYDGTKVEKKGDVTLFK